MRVVPALLLALMATTIDASPLLAQRPVAGGTVAQDQANLQERLENGLEVRLPSERRFIARVVALVNRGRLPQKLVDRTFLWARNKPKNKAQYFIFALRAQAKKIGVAI